MQLLQTLGATYFPRTGEIRFDAAMAWLMLALAMSSALLFGLVPALNATGGSVDESLRSSRSSTASVGVRRLRRVLVGAQFAIATPLLIVAGLLLASLNQLKQVDLGFEDRAGPDRLRPIAGRAVSGTGAHRRVLGRAEAARRGAAGRVGRRVSPTAVPPNQPGQHNNFALEGTGGAGRIATGDAVGRRYRRSTCRRWA